MTTRACALLGMCLLLTPTARMSTTNDMKNTGTVLVEAFAFSMAHHHHAHHHHHHQQQHSVVSTSRRPTPLRTAGTSPRHHRLGLQAVIHDKEDEDSVSIKKQKKPFLMNPRPVLYSAICKLLLLDDSDNAAGASIPLALTAATFAVMLLVASHGLVASDANGLFDTPFPYHEYTEPFPTDPSDYYNNPLAWPRPYHYNKLIPKGITLKRVETAVFPGIYILNSLMSQCFLKDPAILI
jgi:hypothetical protein